MAGATIYLGNLFGSMVTALNAQIAKLDTMITNLSNINTSVGSGIQKGVVLASANQRLILNTADVTSSTSAWVEIGRAKIFCDGKIRLIVNAKHSPGGAYSEVTYSIDAGVTKLTIRRPLTVAYADYSLDIAVSNLQEIIFYCSGGTSGTTTVSANGMRVAYDVKNLAVDGYVIKI